MENEFQILNNIQQNNHATQRDIAKSTGMSLGNVNVLIKRLVKKGLIKIERLNAKSIRYILTPHGIMHNAEATYRYIVTSFKFINEINAKIDSVINNHLFNGERKVVLFGSEDEVYELIKSKLVEARMDFNIIRTLEEALNLDQENTFIIVWHPVYEDKLINLDKRYVNLLSCLHQ